MSFSDPTAITYNAVVKNLAYISDAVNGRDYYKDDGQIKFMMTTRHTIPQRGGSGESHLIRLDADHHDVGGLYLRRCSAWFVVKTFDNTQASTDLGYLGKALAGLLTATNVDKLIARES